MGRKGSKIIPFLCDALKDEKYSNLKYENRARMEFSLSLPRKTRRLNSECEKILKDWRALGKLKYNYTKAKQAMESLLKTSVFLERIQPHGDYLVYRMLSKEEVKEKRRRRKAKSEITSDFGSPSSVTSSGYGSGEDSPSGYASGEDSPTGYVSRGDSPTGYVSGEDSPTGYVSGEDSPTGYVSGEDSPTGYVSGEDFPAEYIAREASPSGYVSGEASLYSTFIDEAVEKKPDLKFAVEHDHLFYASPYHQAPKEEESCESLFPINPNNILIDHRNTDTDFVPQSVLSEAMEVVSEQLILDADGLIENPMEIETGHQVYDVSFDDSLDFQEVFNDLNLEKSGTVDVDDLFSSLDESFFSGDVNHEKPKKKTIKVYECRKYDEYLGDVQMLIFYPKFKEVSSFDEEQMDPTSARLILDNDTLKKMQSCDFEVKNVNDHIFVFLKVGNIESL